MILIRTDYPSFAAYLSGLSKPARKNYRYVAKNNQDLVYTETGFVRDDVERFMKLWEQQLVRGKPINWAFPVGHVEDIHFRGELKVFQATKGSEIIAMHFIQKRDGYWECHPPMYDKIHSQRYLAKYMWFNLICYAIENKFAPLDMGGGCDSWREHIKTRDNYPNPKYKWMYVPEKAKQNPESEPDYYIDYQKCQLLLKS